MTQASSSASSSSRRKAPKPAGQTVPHSELSDVTTDLDDLIPTAPVPVEIPELGTQATSTSRARGNGAQNQGDYVNAFMPLLRRLRRQPPSEITEREMQKLYDFLGDESGEVRVNSAHLSETLSFIAQEMFERYSRQALTLAIYLGQQGLGVATAKRDLGRATGIPIAESDPLNGFPRHVGLKYTVQQLVDAVAHLNEHYGNNGATAPGALTAANEALRIKRESAGQPYRDQD